METFLCQKKIVFFVPNKGVFYKHIIISELKLCNFFKNTWI